MTPAKNEGEGLLFHVGMNPSRVGGIAKTPPLEISTCLAKCEQAGTNGPHDIGKLDGCDFVVQSSL